MAIVNNVNQFNERLAILKKVKIGTGPNGTDKYDWLPQFSCWAYAKTRNVKEIYSDLTVYVDTITMVVRHETAINILPDMRIEWKSKQFEIQKINPDISDKAFDVVLIKEVI